MGRSSPDYRESKSSRHERDRNDDRRRSDDKHRRDRNKDDDRERDRHRRNHDREDRPSRSDREDRPSRNDREERPSRSERQRSRSPRQNRSPRRRRDHDAQEEADVKPKIARNFDPFSGQEQIDKTAGTSSKHEGKDEKISMPSFEPSGKLTADTNTFKGVVIKYNEPPEAAKPRLRWRLYPMKGEEVLKPFYVHRQSAYLIGRDRKIADFPVDHPSCSKQHAVLQYRAMPFERDGHQGRRTLPYIIDLGSANGTYLNSERIEPQRYYELKEQDIIKFGYSQREYAVLHELSAEGKGGDELDIDLESEDEIDREGDAVEEKIKKEEEDYF